MSTYLTEELNSERVPYELIPHPRTESARAEAAALDTTPEQVGKTVVLTGADGFVRAVVPATERLDLRKVRILLNRKDLRLATEAELVIAYPMFELGAVPPVGGPYGDVVVVDLRVAAKDEIVLEAGTHTESVRVPTAGLLDHSAAYIADVCLDRH
jgi:Ala-tRNA(Pro) deacylase